MAADSGIIRDNLFPNPSLNQLVLRSNLLKGYDTAVNVLRGSHFPKDAKQPILQSDFFISWQEFYVPSISKLDIISIDFPSIF
jgi:hypothetical protein